MLITTFVVLLTINFVGMEYYGRCMLYAEHTVSFLRNIHSFAILVPYLSRYATQSKQEMAWIIRQYYNNAQYGMILLITAIANGSGIGIAVVITLFPVSPHILTTYFIVVAMLNATCGVLVFSAYNMKQYIIKHHGNYDTVISTAFKYKKHQDRSST